MLTVTGTALEGMGISIPLNDITWECSRASGPGGQHVNRTDSAVQLRFPVEHPSLPPAVRQRLKEQNPGKVTEEGILCLREQSQRSQWQNRRLALLKLLAILNQAWKAPRIRKKTKPTRASRERRLEAKRRQKEKKLRRKTGVPDSQ